MNKHISKEAKEVMKDIVGILNRLQSEDERRLFLDKIKLNLSI